MARLSLHHGDNATVLPSLPSAGFSLVYVDPPFNTGRTQRRPRVRAERAEAGSVGFGGHTYRRVGLGPGPSFPDQFDDYLGFLLPRLREAHRLLTAEGSLFVHVDPREAHYVKVALDGLFGRDHFQNEIVWAYDYGARSKRRWSAKHDTLLWYSRHPRRYTFHYDAIDRIPYLAPGLVGPEKAARGKTPTDVWWHTIVSPTGRERTGYPTQKPLGILGRIVRVHSSPGDHVLDFFAGSGSFGEAALREGRDATLVDVSAEAVAVMERRLGPWCTAPPVRWEPAPPDTGVR